MEWIPRANWTDPLAVERIVALVRRGGLLAYPTDTLYGLGGDYLDPGVQARLRELKGREGSPFSAAVGSLAMALEIARPCGPLFARMLAELGGRAMTFILPARGGGRPTVGVRLPDLPPLLALIAASGRPWITTSANVSGSPALQDPAAIAAAFPGLDLLLDGGTLPASQGSTIVDLSGPAPVLARRGDRGDEVAAWLAENSRHPLLDSGGGAR